MIGDRWFVPPLGVVVLLLLAWSVIATLRQYFRLRHFKGPFSTGISKLWLIRAVGGGRTHLDLYEACEKYGSSIHVQCTARHSNLGKLNLIQARSRVWARTTSSPATQTS